MSGRWIILGLAIATIESVAFGAGESRRPQLIKEPQYRSENPRYCLLTFGEPVEKAVWIVHDQEVLYVDRNANGDLTEGNEQIRVGEQSDPTKGEYEFVVGNLAVGGRLHENLRIYSSRLRHLAKHHQFRHEYEAADAEAGFYTVWIDVQMLLHRGAAREGRVRQIATYYDRNGFLQFSSDPSRAPVIRFDAPWEIMLTDRPTLTAGRRIDLYLAVGTPGFGPGTSAMIAYDKLIPPEARPEVKVTFPPAGAGMSPVESVYTLRERCCTVNLHGPIEVPRNIGEGEARIELTLHGWALANVADSSGVAEVVAAPPLQLEQVSPRLKRELAHVSREGVPWGLRFSPDGARIIAGDRDSGVVQVWDVASGESLMAIETGSPSRSQLDFFQVSPDWSSLYVPYQNEAREEIGDDGNSRFAFDYDGGIRAWSLATGSELGWYQQNPPTGVSSMAGSQRGDMYLVGEFLKSRPERKYGASLWDAQNGEFRPLDPHLGGGVFSSDGRVLAVSSGDQAIVLIDVASLGRTASIVTERVAYPVAILPDQNLLVGQVFLGPEDDDTTWNACLRFWDTRTGDVLATLPIDKDNISWLARLSPDGTTLAITTLNSDSPKVMTVDVDQHSVVHSVPLDLRVRAYLRMPAFSVDGQWMAVVAQLVPDDGTTGEVDAINLPQPRIFLIDAAKGEVREALVAPQGISAAPCFSPDGKTLATSRNGHVLLWDVSDLTAVQR